MHVVHAGQAPQGLPGLEREAQQRMARQGAVAVAVAVQGQRGVSAQGLYGGVATPVQAGHHTAAAFCGNQVGVAAHGVGFVGDVEGHHHQLAGLVLVGAHAAHDGFDAVGQRCVDRVGADLVVLDEVHAGGAQATGEFAGFLGGQAHIGLDDGADQRTAVHTGQRPGAGDALGGQVELLAVGAGQLHGFEAQACDFAQVEQVARHRGGQRGQVGADVVAGEAHPQPGALPGLGLVEHAAPLHPAVGQGRGGCHVEQLNGFDRGAGAFAQRVGLALHPGEGAAGLLARQHLGHVCGVQGGFDQVGGFEAAGGHVL